MTKLTAFLDNWRPFYFNVTLHLLFLYSFTFMTWELAIYSALLSWLLSGLGNTMLHRYYSHKAFELPRWIELAMLPINTLLAHSGGPIAYASVHRQHHKRFGTNRDVHCPQTRGRLMIALGIWEFFPAESFKKYKAPIPRDLLKDKTLLLFHNYYHRIWLASFILVALINVEFAIILFTWPAMFLKTLANSIINCACHPGTKENSKISKDFPMFAFLTFGESMHKWHHDNPNNYSFSPSFWKDPGTTFINLIKR